MAFKCYNDGVGRAEGIQFELKLFVSKRDFQYLDQYDSVEFSPIGTAGIDDTEHVDNYGEVSVNEGFEGMTSSLRYVSESGERLSDQGAVERNDEETLKIKMRVLHFLGEFADPMDARPTSFSTATERLVELGHTAIGYRISTTYEDIMGNQKEKPSFLLVFVN
jgi:hypothetical protein